MCLERSSRNGAWTTTKIPDAQFGFIPGRNTLQPLFILRHLINAAKHRKAERQIYAAFIDFTQAYDRVNRSMLWDHLASMNVPTILRLAVKGLY